MVKQLTLPDKNGKSYEYHAGNQKVFILPEGPFKSRIAFSAAHVVCDPLADSDPVLEAKIDWENTLAYRRHLWSMGLSVAEAMDTAQRGMGLNWEHAKELIRRSAAEAKAEGGRIACGAGTDQLLPGPSVTLADVQAAYEEQCEFVELHNSQIILMASRALADCAQGPEDYERIYANILRQVSKPVILHWLGDMFDPSLKGYWGYKNLDDAMEVCLNVIWDNKDKVDGIKISLLDASREIEMRRLLPPGVKMYTGDDFNYPELIKGDEHGYSHALLGIFDAIAPAAAAALHALDDRDYESYHALLEKTVPLSRHIFQAPTYSYKTGIVFMAYLNGHQSHFRMIGGAESARSIVHLSELFVLADQAGLLSDPELAAERMKLVLNLAGIRQEEYSSGKL
ncbi:dihydrodipicolinate synthase family protein [Cytobacillus firmus]|uniref:dihydrodipicolinate synthase family protein n=1 Tax=Cytobacillus pseudoceanisediminis TaxID=3051614 RepID=UPI002161EC9E|nr:dihydrodipicolinate synthase family protein [Cytobacillus pseudoceanisediminis]MBY0155523.1 dihydrodipicolinate synthase family protein [Cytobacillus firmus]MCS0823971.1 dihydrodipicolinate synthase family protein [Cytobacillus firmus]UQX55055.1 dihydrodipicolinate synthase family protein [Cytobacillus pseudoceanisediminis]